MSYVYLSGPMTGIPNYNREAFNDAARRWEGAGFKVNNPARLEHGYDRTYYMREAVKSVLAADALVVLDGWKASVGAVIEVVIAGALGTPVYEDAEPLGSIYAARAEDISDALEPGSDRSLAWILAGESSAFERELNAIAALQEAKRADYTGGGNLLANYKFSSASVGLSTLRGMFMRFSEKYYRAQVLINSGDAPQVKDEGIEDTFRDLAIIAILMRLCIKGEDGYEG